MSTHAQPKCPNESPESQGWISGAWIAPGCSMNSWVHVSASTNVFMWARVSVRVPSVCLFLPWFMAVHYQRAAGVFPDAWIFQSPLRFTVNKFHDLAAIAFSFCCLLHIKAAPSLYFLTLCAFNMSNLHLSATKQGTGVYTTDDNDHLG